MIIYNREHKTNTLVYGYIFYLYKTVYISERDMKVMSSSKVITYLGEE